MSGQGQRPAPRSSDASDVVDVLTRYAVATTVPGSADLVVRIQRRVAQEPQTPPRRFLMAVAGLRVRDAIGAFRQTALTAYGGRGARVALQVQATAVVLTVVALLGVLGMGASLSVGSWLRGMDTRPAAPLPSAAPPSLVAGPSPKPSADHASPPHPTRSPAPADRQVVPTAAPDRTHRPRTSSRSDPGPEPTKRHEPRRTHRPEPRRTDRPDRTPRPRVTERPTSTETSEPSDDEDDGSGGDGGDGHGDDDEGREDADGSDG